MPNIKQQKKRLRKDKELYKKNKSIKTKVKNAKKKVLNSKNYEEASKNLKRFYEVMDKAVKKGYYHKNKAARNKSQPAKHVDSLKEAK